MCPCVNIGVTRLPMNCYFSEISKHYKNPIMCVSLVQRDRHHLIEMYLVLALSMI